jgi:hypothetical protein
MRHGVKQLGRAVSIGAFLLLLAAPASNAAGVLGDFGGDYTRTISPGRRIAETVAKWVCVTLGDEMIVPRP